MKKTILAVLLAGTALVGTANAATVGTGSFGQYDFNYGTLGNPLPYGIVTVTDLGGGLVQIKEEMAPNYILNTGNHLALTFNLAGSGSIVAGSLPSLFSIATPGPFSNPPYGSFTDGIAGDCGNGASSGGCGTTLTFNFKDFSGLIANEFLLGGVLTSIFFASDIANIAGSGATGVVGAGGIVQTPITPALALFGAGLVGIGMLKRVTKKRKQTDAALA
jgi:hypothetical protein